MNATPAIAADEAAVSPYGSRWTRWIRPVILSLALVLFDALGVFAAAIGIFLLCVYLPRSLLAGKFAACRRERLIRLALYLAAVAVVLSLIPINKRIAEERAGRIIAAVESFKAANGNYPDRLDQLVPQFIAEIPGHARIAVADIGFRYFAGEHPQLMYVAMPPFGRKVYHFASKSWGFID